VLYLTHPGGSFLSSGVLLVLLTKPMKIALPPRVYESRYQIENDQGAKKDVPLSCFVHNELGLKTEHAKIFLRYCFAQAILFDKKQQDYGPHNIAKHGIHGVLVRMSDKVERLATLFKSKRRKPQNESISDTFQDISNYGIIAQMVDDGQWPTV